jgi:hypothetical protein
LQRSNRTWGIQSNLGNDDGVGTVHKKAVLGNRSPQEGIGRCGQHRVICNLQFRSGVGGEKKDNRKTIRVETEPKYARHRSHTGHEGKGKKMAIGSSRKEYSKELEMNLGTCPVCSWRQTVLGTRSHDALQRSYRTWRTRSNSGNGDGVGAEDFLQHGLTRRCVGPVCVWVCMCGVCMYGVWVGYVCVIVCGMCMCGVCVCGVCVCV